MSRKSKRELERALEDLTDGSDGGTDNSRPWLVYDMDGEYLDKNGDPFPTDDDGEPVEPPNDSLVILDGEYATDAPERVGA